MATDHSAHAFEIWEDPTGSARFYFSHSDKQSTTGVLVLLSGAELPKHHRPMAFENLLQLSGECTLTELDEDGNIDAAHVLLPGNYLRLDKGKWHIHANVGEEESATMFKAEGDITAIVARLRDSCTAVKLHPAD